MPNFFKKLGPINKNKIQKSIECDFRNISDDVEYEYLLGIKKITENNLTFLYDTELIHTNKINNFSIVCSPKISKYFDLKQKLIVVEDVQYAVARLSNLFYRDFSLDEIEAFDKPKIGSNCSIAKSARIANGAIIGNNVNIGDGVIIKYNCIIGDETNIDENSVLSNTILSENVKIGRNCSIGQVGFGFYLSLGGNVNIYHMGRVIIKSNVSIGSGCTIDRGNFNDTVIGENTYFDNLCHVAHNVEVGSNCAFAAMSGIAGSAKIGNNVLAGGQTGIAGHINIGDNVRIAAKSGVFNNVANSQSVMGNPAIQQYKFLKKYIKTYGK